MLSSDLDICPQHLIK